MRGFVVFFMGPEGVVHDRNHHQCCPVLAEDEMEVLSAFRATFPGNRMLGMMSMEEMESYWLSVNDLARQQGVSLASHLTVRPDASPQE